MVSESFRYVTVVSKILRAPANEEPKIWIVLSDLHSPL